jgi:hypothetical protein
MPPPCYTLRPLRGRYAVCRLPAHAPLPAWAGAGDFWSITRTPDELSIICPQASVPAGVTATPDWRLYQVVGPFDFAVTGVLATLTTTLAQAAVVILAVATYDTDYLLIQETQAAMAEAALLAQGHRLLPPPADHAAPDHAAPDHAAPDHAAPDHAAPDGALPVG